MTTAPALATTTNTPNGTFTLVATPDAVVLASGWTTSVADLLRLIHATIRPGDVRAVPATTPEVSGAAEAAAAYYDGELTAIDKVTVRQVSGPFREHAWSVLRQVTAGSPVTYAQYAALCGRPAAIRAAASACAMNAAALFVPCHRVLRTDGTLGGFRYGLGIKESLLARESLAPGPVAEEGLRVPGAVPRA